MPHEISLITTIAAGFGLALVFGLIASKLRIPAIVGYLVAGMIIGPGTPGFVADVGLAGQLAEIGVMLLMFGVGLHLSMGELLSVKRIAVPGAIVQIALATLFGMGAAKLWGWSTGASLVFGFSLATASTVVLLRALESRGILESQDGRIAIGWLVVEDLACVLALVLLPPLATLLGGNAPAGAPAGGSLLAAVAITLGKVALFVVLMLVVGKRVFPRILFWVARTGSRELFTLCVLATAIGVAYGSAKLFDVSFALGAFFAGMMMRESEFAHRAADESLPLRDAFSVLFFVSVGMLFDPRVLLEQPVKVLVVVAIIMIGKTLGAVGLVLALRYPLHTALTVGAALAQIGEFAFIIAVLGRDLGLLPAAGHSLILVGSIISIGLNPVVFSTVEPIAEWLKRHSALARRLAALEHETAALPTTVDEALLTGQVVLVGYGRVGRRIAEALSERRVPCVVAEMSRDAVADLREKGIPAVSGDASDPTVLVQAHVATAAMLVVATPDPVKVRKMVEVARTLNPSIEIVLRTHTEEEAELLREEKAGKVFMGEHELALAMAGHVLARMDHPSAA
ncbi:MAG TPA: YbaL family putative K(+) efflux transporter [Thermoanaerobaculia bacterium]|nr:YbaL family putative K(+) efflux transporter [Thermoanaerobaculia bacterium]